MISDRVRIMCDFLFLIVNTYWANVNVHFIGWEESVADEKITEDG